MPGLFFFGGTGIQHGCAWPRSGEGPAALDQEERRVPVLPPIQIILKKAKKVVAKV